MKQTDFDMNPVAFDQREAFEIWHDRFVREYNRSEQDRVGHELVLGTPAEHWQQSFDHEVGPRWIQYRGRNIGFAAPQQISIGLDEQSATPLRIVSDVYIDPKFRGRGLLAAVLMAFREEDMDTILIDSRKLKDNAGYYYGLGFRFGCHWLDQGLILISVKSHGEWFQRIWPDDLEAAE